MLVFEIDSVLSSNDRSEKQFLHGEWTIICKRAIFNPSVQIQRLSTHREYSVSGYLNIFEILEVGMKQIYGKDFLEKLLPAHSFVTITPYKIHDLDNIGAKFLFQGFVRIKENSDVKVDRLQIKESRKIYQPKCQENGKSKEEFHQKSLDKLLYDFERLLDPILSDVNLKCGEATIPAHKVILSTRSPVFAAMFAHLMKESSENEVDISDIDVSTLRALLMYLYTEKTSDITDSSATDLLFAADKYQLQELKSVCSDFLKGSVSIQNVLRILVVGDMIDADLKSFAMDYICNKCDEFSALENTEEWKSLPKERPALSLEILTSMVKSMNEKLKK